LTRSSWPAARSNISVCAAKSGAGGVHGLDQVVLLFREHVDGHAIDLVVLGQR
jgi:hypothetical protein